MERTTRGERLRLARAAAKLRGEDAADKVGVTRSQLYRYERGEVDPPLETLLQLSELYGVTTEFLIHGADAVSST